MNRLVLIAGRQGSGKSTLARHLKDELQNLGLKCKIIHLADQIRDLCLELNPWIKLEFPDNTFSRLKDLVKNARDWDLAKNNYLEVRSLLQNAGQAVKKYDQYIWLRNLNSTLNSTTDHVFIIPDIRFEFEPQVLINHSRVDKAKSSIFFLEGGKQTDSHVSERLTYSKLVKLNLEVYATKNIEFIPIEERKKTALAHIHKRA